MVNQNLKKDNMEDTETVDDQVETTEETEEDEE